MLALLLGASETFSQVLVPYRSGKLWGLADTLGKIKLVPQYDEIDASVTSDYWKLMKRGYQFFVVRKGKHYGLLNRTQIIMEPKYHKLRLDSLFVEEDNSDPKNPTLGGSRVMIYDLRGKLLIADTVQQVEAINNKSLGRNLLFSVMAEHKKAGIFWYDSKEQKILQWVIKNVNYVAASTNQDQLGVYVQQDPKGPETFYSIDFKPQSKAYQAKLAAVPRPQAQISYEEMRRSSGPGSSVENFFVRDIEFKIIKGNIIQLRRDGHYQDRRTKADTIKFNIGCDTAWVSKFLFGGSLTSHSTYSYNTNSRLKATDTGFNFQDYLLYRKNGKLGVIIEQAVIPPLYDEIRYFMAGIYEKPYFLVARTVAGKQKWGVVKSDGTLVLPIVYDEIIRGNGGGGSWVLKKDNLYGLANYLGKIIVPATYEHIIPGEHFSGFLIEDKGKYGFINPWEGMFAVCKPVFSYKIQGPAWFGNYAVWELVDSNGKSLGYGDGKDFLYFKD